MTARVKLFPIVGADRSRHATYHHWCYNHLHIDGNAKCWAYWCDQIDPHHYMIFEHEEDATAFKIAFGL